MNEKKGPGAPLNQALLALTASALAIPGMSAQAQGVSDDPMPPTLRDHTLLDYRFSYYDEGHLAAGKAARRSRAPWRI